MLRWISGWVAASLLAYVLGSALMTQRVLANLAKFDAPAVGIGTRFTMTIADIQGLSASYLPLLGIALLIAFLVATLLNRRLRLPWLPICLAAGGAGVLCLLLLVQQALGLNPLTGTRGVGGHLLQTLAGLAGGWLFARLAGPVRRD